MAAELRFSGSPLLQQAVDKYHTQSSVIGGLSTHQTSLHELTEDIIRLEQQSKCHKIKGAYNITSRLEGLIAFVDRYAPAMDCLVQTCSGSMINPAALIWGLIRILLEIVSSATRYFPSLLELLDELNTTVSIYVSYEAIFVHYPRFQQVLLEVYTDIIAILDKARRILTEGKYKLLLRSLRTKFETDFKGNLALIKRHMVALENETTLAHRKEMHLFVAEARDGLGNNAAERTNTDTEERIYRWLAPLDCDARFEEINRVRHAGSCSWLLDQKVYLTWKTVDENPILWISGPPGIGKTVLSSAIIADIRDTISAPACIAMFHCDANDRQSRSMDVLCASIIAKLATNVPQEHLADGVPSCLASAHRKSLRFGRTSLSKADSPDDLVAGLSAFFKNVWVVIDGLDELDQPERAQELLKISALVGPTFRLLVLSRRTTALQKVFENVPEFQIHPSNVQKDIHQYVDARSREIPVSDDATRQHVAQAVYAKAEGMFLWTRFVMEDLVTATSLEDIQQILVRFPVGVSGVYDRFLIGLTSQPIHRQQLARHILRWICCAFRPLRMVDMNSSLPPNTSNGVLYNDKKPQAFRSAMIDVCQPFLVLNDTLDTLRPVHQSFREYLLGPSTSGITYDAARFLIDPKTTHCELSLRCIRYCRSRRLLSSETIGSSDDFWNYAMTYWCQHTVHGSYNDELESEIVDLISTPDKRQHWLWWMLFGNHGSPFSLAKIVRLQKELKDWAEPSTRQETLKSLTGKGWNMDCLELLIKATHRREGLSKLSATYFETMMVARGLVRGLKRDGQILEAIERLEQLKATLEDEWKVYELGFVHSLLGLLHDQGGHVCLALQAQQSALSIQEDSGENHAQVLWTMNEIGRMYRHIGLLEDSERMHRKVLEQLTANLPEDHPETIWTINTLATTLRKRNRAEEALSLHLRAYDSRRKSLGELHAHTLWSSSDVAKCYQDQSLFNDALMWYQKTLDGRVQTLGPEHPDTLWSMNHLGMVLADLDRTFQAVEIHKQALKAQEKVIGPDHNHTCWTRDIVKGLESSSETSMVLR